MQTKGRLTFLFVGLFLLSLLLFIVSQKNIFGGFGIVGNALFPVQELVFNTLTFPSRITAKKDAVQVLDKEIVKTQDTVNIQSLKADNNALRDQFATSQTQSLVLLPSRIIGAPQFLPGVSLPESIVIDQGSTRGVSVGQAVIYKNVLLGTVVSVRPTAALVKLVSGNGISFTAKTNQTNALGVLKGSGNNTMILDNVVLSDELKIGDEVVTSMGEDVSGKGYPPGLLIGKIVSVEKNPSSLFQRASIKGLIDIVRIPFVFVVKGTK